MRTLSRSEHLAAWLCGTGLLLGSAGLWALRYFPLTPEEEENQRLLREVHLPAAEQVALQNPENTSAQAALAQLRKTSVYDRRPAPFRNAGAVAVVTGTALFLAGAFLWFRSRHRRASRWVKANEDV